MPPGVAGQAAGVVLEDIVNLGQKFRQWHRAERIPMTREEVIVDDVGDDPAESSHGRLKASDTPPKYRMAIRVGIDLAMAPDASLEFQRQIKQRRRWQKIRQHATEAKFRSRFRQKEMSQPIHGTTWTKPPPASSENATKC